MPDWLEAVLTRLILVSATLLFVGGLIFLTRQLNGAWWPTVIFQLAHRPSATRPPLWGSFAAIVVVFGLLGGATTMMTAILLWVLVSPRWIAAIASHRAWRDDKADEGVPSARDATSNTPPLRYRAAEVRNRIRERLEESPIDVEKPWAEYIVDAAKAEREKSYQERFEEARV